MRSLDRVLAAIAAALLLALAAACTAGSTARDGSPYTQGDGDRPGAASGAGGGAM